MICATDSLQQSSWASIEKEETKNIKSGISNYINASWILAKNRKLKHKLYTCLLYIQ